MNELKEALEAAGHFIDNGIEFGYIMMPEVPDPACDTPEIIAKALAALRSGELVVTQWYKFPESPPRKINGYRKYIVCTEGGQVYECSWMNNGWHIRMNGCSEVTDYVVAWCEYPTRFQGGR